MDDGEAEEGELEEGKAAEEPKDTAMPDADPEGAFKTFLSRMLCEGRRVASNTYLAASISCHASVDLPQPHSLGMRCFCGQLDFHPRAGETAVETAAVAAPEEPPAAEPTSEQDLRGWQEAMADIRAALPENVWESISPEFFLAFWSLRYEDIVVPVER